MAKSTITPTPRPMTTAQARAVDKHRAELMASWRASGKTRVTIKFDTGVFYNHAPAVVRLKRSPSHEGVSEYSLPGVYLDAVRFLVQCSGFTPAKARRVIGESFLMIVETLPEGAEFGRRQAKAFVRDCLTLAEEYAGTAEGNLKAGRKPAKWLLVDGQTVADIA